MATYQIELKNRQEIATGTFSFFFEKPAGFEFTAGQFLRFTLIDPPETDAEGDSRTFSVASAPDEDGLMIATRMRDTAFKRVLKSMPLGAEITAKGPYGRMTLHEDASRPAVFLTGGIGITPFRSIAVGAAHAGLAHRIRLFYSNRRPEDAAFLDELAELEAVNRNYRFIPTMTSAAGSKQGWTGETGYINADMLARYVEDPATAVYYVAGPEGLVNAMRKTLADAGVSETDIRAEEFAGY
ncbi:MAG TPA: FAD-dependent oxidoreductase [Blastocatellia bacterium]|nr:FAD-dependent oxidoreductase [Blastocatellia bacterium]